MRVLYLTLLDFPRRVANRGQIFNMCEGFAQHAECTLVIAHSYLSEQELRAYYGVGSEFKIKVLGNRIRQSRLLTLVRLLILLVTARPNVIYVREEKLAYLLSFLPWKYVYEIHETFPANQQAQIRAINKSTMTVAILESLRAESIQLGADGSRIVVENLAINAAHYGASSSIAVPEVVRSEKGRVKLLYSGRFSIQKGVFSLVECMVHLPDTFDLVMLGGFEGEAEVIEAHARALGVIDRVKIAGHVPHAEVSAYLRAADILVLPNSNDPDVVRHTNPLKLYEYLAAGKPVVASRIDAISSLVSEDILAFFEPDDPRDMARVILETSRNGEAAATRASKGREYVSTRSWISRTARILESLQRQANQRNQDA